MSEDIKGISALAFRESQFFVHVPYLIHINHMGSMHYTLPKPDHVADVRNQRLCTNRAGGEISYTMLDLPSAVTAFHFDYRGLNKECRKLLSGHGLQSKAESITDLALFLLNLQIGIS